MRFRLLLAAVVLLVAPMAFAGTYSLNDWCFYVNSLAINHSCNNGSGTDNFLPAIDLGSFDYAHLDNNSGTVTLPPGTYNVFAIYNYDIGDDPYNEYATAFGSLSIGQLYSIGLEGSGTTPGSLYSQFASGNLDNTNHQSGCCGDVSASIGYSNLVVPPGSNSTVNFVVSDTPPDSGFYIGQTDNGSGQSVYISSNTGNSGGGSPGPNLLTAESIANPEPGTTLLMGGGMGLLLWFVRRRRQA